MIIHDRWQQIKEIFYSAQEHTPAERSAFLDEVCGNDAAMREEVEALLTADADNEDFLSSPAYEFAASLFADELSEFSAGQEVGQYKIECLLGAGGMGQIYEAHDTKLGRKIALKFISPEFATNHRRVQRFEQEARAASALNHPNVCVIHDVGKTENGRHFIAMEFILGSTLRDKLTLRGPFTPLEALQIIIQVGDALASAHAKRIVHRDIKPENIMLRPDGIVKVVDFGLAKLTEIVPEQRHTGEPGTQVLTEAHTLMGTVKYMSPEQLREVPVDEQTDIWSLGVVLYEMLTGATPFEARAPNDSIALILAPQPAEFRFSDEIPIRLREIVRKALEKDRAQRYQTVTKLTADLRKLKWELEHNEESYTIPELPAEPIFHGPTIFTRLKSQAILTADSLFTEIKTHKTASVFAGGTSVLALLVLFFLPRWLPLPGLFSPPPVQQPGNVVNGPSIKSLTNSGTSVCAAISPDGKLIAHAEEQNGKQQLLVTNTVTFSSSVAVPADDVQYLGISFSRDNSYLYFTSEENGAGNLYRLAWPGNNQPIKVKEHVDSPISFSPQGDRFAFVRHNKKTTEYSLMLSNVDGTNEQVVATRKNGDTFSVHGPAWSPDGGMIVCPAGYWGNGFHMNLMGFDLKSGNEQRISNLPWFSILQVAWQEDMSHLFFSARERETFPHRVWWMSFPDGTPQNLTNDSAEYENVSFAGNNIVTVRKDHKWRIWVVPLDHLDKTTAIAQGRGFTYGISWTSKGKIVFSSMAADRQNISSIEPDGSNPVQLTANAGDNYSPASSPDGQFIVFTSNRNGPFNIWRMNDDGSNPTQLTFNDGNFYPSVSPDSQWVAYDNLVNASTSVWKVLLAGGEPVKVGDKYRMPVFSPTNQFIAARYDTDSGSRDVAIFPAQGGRPLRYFKVPVQEWQRIQWLPNGHELSYVNNENGYSNIWTYDLYTGKSRQITQFNADQIYAYAWSPDYKQIACVRGNRTNDVMMISNSEP